MKNSTDRIPKCYLFKFILLYSSYINHKTEHGKFFLKAIWLACENRAYVRYYFIRDRKTTRTSTVKLYKNLKDRVLKCYLI